MRSKRFFIAKLLFSEGQFCQIPLTSAGPIYWEKVRNNGYGEKLMRKAESLARKRGCLFMAVNTMDLEAKPFYEKLGFEVEFIREGFEKGSKMYFLRKQL